MIAKEKPGITRADAVILAAVALAVGAAVLFVVRSDYFGLRGPGLGPDFAFREPPRNIPRQSVRYARALTIPTGYAAPSALAVDSQDRIYVGADGQVALWDPDGKPLGKPLSGLDGTPRCIAVAPDGRIYLGLGGEVRVYAGGKQLAVLPRGVEGVVNRILLTDKGVFAAVHKSVSSGFVLQYDPGGDLCRTIALADVTLLSSLLDAAAVDDGLRVTNPGAVEHGRIRAYDYEGRFRYDWGRYDTTGDIADQAGCCNPVRIAALADGRIVTAEKGDQAIIKVYRKDTPDARPAVDSIVAVLKGATGLDLAVDSRQRILVLDTTAGAVYVFERRGP